MFLNSIYEKCKGTQGLISCYRWFDYFGTLFVGVETTTYKLTDYVLVGTIQETPTYKLQKYLQEITEICMSLLNITAFQKRNKCKFILKL